MANSNNYKQNFKTIARSFFSNCKQLIYHARSFHLRSYPRFQVDNPMLSFHPTTPLEMKFNAFQRIHEINAIKQMHRCLPHRLYDNWPRRISVIYTHSQPLIWQTALLVSVASAKAIICHIHTINIIIKNLPTFYYFANQFLSHLKGIVVSHCSASSSISSSPIKDSSALTSCMIEDRRLRYRTVFCGSLYGTAYCPQTK